MRRNFHILTVTSILNLKSPNRSANLSPCVELVPFDVKIGQHGCFCSCHKSQENDPLILPGRFAYTRPIRRISYLRKYGGVEQATFRTGRSPNGGSKLISITRNDDDSAEPACSSAPYSAQDAYSMCQNDLPIRNRDSMPAIFIKDT